MESPSMGRDHPSAGVGGADVRLWVSQEAIICVRDGHGAVKKVEKCDDRKKSLTL